MYKELDKLVPLVRINAPTVICIDLSKDPFDPHVADVRVALVGMQGFRNAVLESFQMDREVLLLILISAL